MLCGSFYLPKDNELKPQGEDAHFICAEEQTIGVADGVGGWAKKGIDAGKYARELMTNCVIAIHSEPMGAVDPKNVLYKAYSNTKAEGSCTACIMTLKGHILHAVNVGDSGFMLLRNGKLIYQSPVQQHSFNCPFQLGSSKDHPSSAQELEVAVKAGDMIIAGTDGLFDNMWASEIEEISYRHSKEGIEPQQLGCMLANLALYNSFDKFGDTPFARASRWAGHNYMGGKIDDITIIVGHII